LDLEVSSPEVSGMESNVVQAKGREANRRVEDLKAICSQARSIEEILLLWIGKGRKVVVSRNDDDTEPGIEFAFLLGSEIYAHTIIPVQRFLATYPDFQSLNEDVTRFDDQDGSSPDGEWFEKRNARLGVLLDGRRSVNIAPPSALGELVLSYALSSVGFAEVGLARKANGDRYVKLSLVYFGNAGVEQGSGWYEQALVSLPALKMYVPSAYWV